MSNSLASSVAWDPEALGAKCSVCPLKGCAPVAPDNNRGATIAVVVEAPGEQEERQGRQLLGPNGDEFGRALRGAGLKRSDTFITSVLSCRPPGNDLQNLLRKISKYNKGQDDANHIPSPIDCCRPRLLAEVSKFENFITLGTAATRAITGHHASILAIRGGLQDLAADEDFGARKVMPSVSPGFVLKAQRWAHVFRNDIFKAALWFNGQADWQPPQVVINPSFMEIVSFFTQKDRIFTFDLETDGIEPLTAKIRCIGIGFEDKVIVIGFLGKDGVTRYRSPEEDAQLIAMLKDFFEDRNVTKCGHNSGSYDACVLREQWGVNLQNHIDTILLHRCVESELPHSLAFVASLYTSAPSWKSDREGNKIATGAETDLQLWEYCAKDVAVTAAVLPKLVEHVRLRDQVKVWQLDQKIQRVCLDMHTVGMYVDQAVRLKEEKRLLALRFHTLKTLREQLEATGSPRADFNPGSIYHIRDLLFGKWQLDPQVEDEDKFTASGDLSTGDLILRALLTSDGIQEDHREAIKLIRRYRKVMKVLGTYVVKLRPSNVKIDADLGWDEEEDWDDRETRKRYGIDRVGIVNPATNRMYPGYNAHVAVTGRLSSSRPINAQNFPKSMRKIITCQPGNVLVGADMDQLELRIAAARWHVELYLRAFAEGKDPHSMTAFAVFGEAFCAAAGVDPGNFSRPGILVGTDYDQTGKFIGKGESKKFRDLSKAVQYASQYEATPETVHELIKKTEIEKADGTTDLPYSKMPLRKVREMRENWLRGAPEFEAGWASEMELYRNQGFIAEPVTNRRRDFMDGENPNEISNFAIQSSGAGLMNKAILPLHEAIPLHKWGPGTGITNQCHDSIMIECPADKAEWVKGLLEECLNQTHPDLPGVTFSASADIGHSWDKV